MFHCIRLACLAAIGFSFAFSATMPDYSFLVDWLHEDVVLEIDRLRSIFNSRWYDDSYFVDAENIALPNRSDIIYRINARFATENTCFSGEYDIANIAQMDIPFYGGDCVEIPNQNKSMMLVGCEDYYHNGISLGMQYRLFSKPHCTGRSFVDFSNTWAGANRNGKYSGCDGFNPVPEEPFLYHYLAYQCRSGPEPWFENLPGVTVERFPTKKSCNERVRLESVTNYIPGRCNLGVKVNGCNDNNMTVEVYDNYDCTGPMQLDIVRVNKTGKLRKKACKNTQSRVRCIP